MVGGWLSALEAQVQSGDLTQTMKRTYEWGFAQFLDWLDYQGVQQVHEHEIRRWIESLKAQGHNSFSIGFWLDCVKSYYSWAVRQGLVNRDPTLSVHLPG